MVILLFSNPCADATLAAASMQSATQAVTIRPTIPPVDALWSKPAIVEAAGPCVKCDAAQRRCLCRHTPLHLAKLCIDARPYRKTRTRGAAERGIGYDIGQRCRYRVGRTQRTSEERRAER